MYKKVISIVVVLAIVFTGGYLTAKQLVPDSKNVSGAPRYATKAVERGDIVQGVNITGQLNGNWGGSIGAPKPDGAVDSIDYVIEEIFVKPNQMVKKGDSLIRLSSSNLGDKLEEMSNTIQTKQEEIAEKNKAVKSGMDTLENLLNRKISDINQINPYDGIVFTAPIRGRLTELNVEEGERLAGINIATIVDDSKVKIPFKVNTYEYPNIQVGQKVLIRYGRELKNPLSGTTEVQIAFDGFYTGTIKKISSNAVPNSDGITYVHNGTIEADNPGLVQPGMVAFIYTEKDGMAATPFIYNSKVDSFVNEKKVSYSRGVGSDANIVATEVYVSANEFVEEGEIIARIAGKDVAENIKNDVDAIKKLYEDISKINKEIEEIHKKVDKVSNLTSKFMVTSPSDGMVSYLMYNVGDVVKGVTDGSDRWSIQLIDMYNTDEMFVNTTVSDLDVLYIRQDAMVTVTVDALPGEEFEGTVMGMDQYTDRDGKTVYNVQIRVEGREGLRPGMNTNCFVNSGESTNTLLIPIEAVFEENGRQKVEVMNEAGEVEVVEIEAGLMNDKYVEVLSGLEEGQQVVTGSTKDLMPSQKVPENDSLLPSAN